MMSEKLSRKVDLLFGGFARSSMDLILLEVLNQAAQHWAGLDEDDFCVQVETGGGSIVFGGLNRLIWSVKRGFYPDVSYCTPRFLARCKELKGVTS